MAASRLLKRLRSAFATPNTAPATSQSAASLSEVKASLHALDKNPYLYVADWDLQIISIFDDLKYDRADVDTLAGPMRRHLLHKLLPLGFKQITGHIMAHEAVDMRLIMPKFRALGESPFDVTRSTPRRAQDFYVLTPTQSACMLIDAYPVEEAQDRILALIKQQPINIYRILDYMARDDHRELFKPVLGHLKYVQREAVRSEPLCRRRALR